MTRAATPRDPAERDARIVKAYRDNLDVDGRAGISTVDLAARFGVGRSYVMRVLRAAGVVVSRVPWL